MPNPVGTSNPPVYNNPFRNAHIVPERVDMGVDFQGSGPIFALAPGTITESDNSWLGAQGAPFPGTFIIEHITEGPLKDLNVYLAEDVNSAVHVGEHVDSNTVIANFTGAGQSETGYAVGATAPGETMAMKFGQVGPKDPGSVSSAFGEAYDQVLVSAGAPKGSIQGSGVVGSVPKNWPVSVSGDVASGGNPNGGNTNVSTTAFSFNPVTGILGNFFGTGADWKDMIERLGLILLGGVLILVGVWMLAGKQTLQYVVPETRLLGE